MTDNEIIKSLECCIEGYCPSCLYGNTDQRHCKDDLMTNAIDLINRTKEKEKHYRRKVQNQREIINALQEKTNRQKAEVDNYKKIAETQQSLAMDRHFEIKRLKAEIERLTLEKGLLEDCYAKLQKSVEIYKNRIKAAKAEAVKEFAERLKERMKESKYRVNDTPYSRACNDVVDFWINDIDNLLKEMVGEADA